MAAAAREL
jgi:hypothetical protein